MQYLARRRGWLHDILEGIAVFDEILHPQQILFELSLRIVEESIDRLYPGGVLFLYTGTTIVDGVDQFFAAVRSRLEERDCDYTYEEIDPDVFGEELESAPYDRVDRIAVVALTIRNSKE